MVIFEKVEEMEGNLVLPDLLNLFSCIPLPIKKSHVEVSCQKDNLYYISMECAVSCWSKAEMKAQAINLRAGWLVRKRKTTNSVC